MGDCARYRYKWLMKQRLAIYTIAPTNEILNLNILFTGVAASFVSDTLIGKKESWMCPSERYGNV